MQVGKKVTLGQVGLGADGDLNGEAETRRSQHRGGRGQTKSEVRTEGLGQVDAGAEIGPRQGELGGGKTGAPVLLLIKGEDTRVYPTEGGQS